MTTQTVTQSERTLAMVRGEANALAQLIEKRNEWLNKAESKMASTFEATKKDTLDMVWRHEELVKEIELIEREN